MRRTWLLITYASYAVIFSKSGSGRLFAKGGSPLAIINKKRISGSMGGIL